MILRSPIYQGEVTLRRTRCRDTRWMEMLKGGWSALSVIEVGEKVCDYGEELQGGDPVVVEP